LPELERDRLRAFLALQVNAFYRSDYFQKDGIVRDEVWKAQRQLTASLLRQAWTHKVWSDSRLAFSDEFGAFIDGLIRKGEAAE
jgi:hypothetical protein